MIANFKFSNNKKKMINLGFQKINKFYKRRLFISARERIILKNN